VQHVCARVAVAVLAEVLQATVPDGGGLLLLVLRHQLHPAANRHTLYES
jgi:hypothetical protein